jgi:hypothetical protein
MVANKKFRQNSSPEFSVIFFFIYSALGWALLRFHQIKATVPINNSGSAARYTMPELSPWALFAPSPAAVLVQVTQPWAQISAAGRPNMDRTESTFFIFKAQLADNDPIAFLRKDKETVSGHKSAFTTLYITLGLPKV